MADSSAAGEGEGEVSAVTEYRWASETGAHSMPHPEELEWLGYVRVCRDPRYPSSVLMKREVSS